jgi:parallel beta-helix repeat protein
VFADAESRLDIADSTFVGNRATSAGGCFSLYGNSVTTITNSTISSSQVAR